MKAKNWLISITACFVLLFAFAPTYAQTGKFFTKEGHISFFSEAPMEKIEAENYKATSVLDTETGKMEFAVLIKAFEFEKALMQEHFNENYMESDKYPKGVFKGAIENIGDVNFAEAGTYTVKVAGDLTIHGVTNPVTTEGVIEVGAENIKANSSFIIAVADYDIEIPAVVKDNIAKEVEIKVEMDYQPFKR